VSRFITPQAKRLRSSLLRLSKNQQPSRIILRHTATRDKESTRTKSIRLHQVWQPKMTRSPQVEDDQEDEQPYRPAMRSCSEGVQSDASAEAPSPTRISLHPHDPHTGEEIGRGGSSRAMNTSAAGSSR
jgi:hypothetical protein